MKPRILIPIIAALAFTGAAYSQSPDRPRPDGSKPDASMAERAKNRIEQLRKDGKNEEADNMEKRVKAMTERMAAGSRDGQPKSDGPKPDAAMAERIKSHLEQLRKDGKNEEADRMEKRVKEYKDHMSSAHHEGQAKAPVQSREDAQKAFMSMAERMKKHLVEELRHDGKNEEADRIDAMAKKFAENMAKHRSEQQAQPSGKDGKGPAPTAKGDQANAESKGDKEHQHGQWGGRMTPWASPGAWGQHRGHGDMDHESREHHRDHGDRADHRGHGGKGHEGHGHHRGHGGRGHEGHGHHRGHGGRADHRGHGDKGRVSHGQHRGHGGCSDHSEQGGRGHEDQGEHRGHGGRGEEHGQKGPSSDHKGGPQGRGFGMPHGMTPWGAPPWAGQHHKSEGKEAPKGENHEHKGGMPPKGGPPAWGGKMPHHPEFGEAPKGDKPKDEDRKDGEKKHEKKDGHHHDEKKDGPKEEIRPAVPNGEPAEDSVGEPPQI